MSLVEMWGVGLNFGVEVLRFFSRFCFSELAAVRNILLFSLFFARNDASLPGFVLAFMSARAKKETKRQTSWIFRGVCECFRFEKTSRNECFRFEKTFPKKPKIWDTFSSSEDKTWKFLCWWMTGFNRIWRNRGGGYRWISWPVHKKPGKGSKAFGNYGLDSGFVFFFKAWLVGPHFLGGGGLGTRNWGYLNCLFCIKMR